MHWHIMIAADSDEVDFNFEFPNVQRAIDVFMKFSEDLIVPEKPGMYFEEYRVQMRDNLINEGLDAAAWVAVNETFRVMLTPCAECVNVWMN